MTFLDPPEEVQYLPLPFLRRLTIAVSGSRADPPASRTSERSGATTEDPVTSPPPLILARGRALEIAGALVYRDSWPSWARSPTSVDGPSDLEDHTDER